MTLYRHLLITMVSTLLVDALSNSNRLHNLSEHSVCKSNNFPNLSEQLVCKSSGLQNLLELSV